MRHSVSKLKAAIALLTLILFGGCGAPADPVSAGTQVVALKAALAEIQHTLDGLQIGTNQIMTDRIHQARVEAQALVGDLDRLQQNGFTNANDVLNDVTRSTHKLSGDLRGMVKETEHQVFLDLNSSLVNLNNTLDGLPLVNIDPYVAAVEPMRIPSAPFDRRVTLHGYFPTLKKGKGGVRVSILGKTVNASLAVGGRVFFDLPAGMFKEQTYIPFTVEISPDANFFSRLWKRKQTIDDRLYVERSTPYSCTLTSLTTNPEWEVEVGATSEFTDRAATEGGAGKPSVNRSLTAQELFTATVANAASLYDTATVKIKNPRARTWDGKPCDHANPSASYTWTPESISYSLNAPSVGGHFHEGNCWQENLIIGSVKRCDPPTFKGGGGSHADVGINPLFTAHRLNVPQHVETTAGQFVMGRHKTVEHSVAALPGWRFRVSCSYKDGAEEWDTQPLSLVEMDPEETVDDITARFSDGKVFVSSAH